VDHLTQVVGVKSLIGQLDFSGQTSSGEPRSRIFGLPFRLEIFGAEATPRNRP
jgi:hypothetical protein